jgi:hypothetical protein
VLFFSRKALQKYNNFPDIATVYLKIKKNLSLIGEF